jgi:hypothetical protein
MRLHGLAHEAAVVDSTAAGQQGLQSVQYCGVDQGVVMALSSPSSSGVVALQAGSHSTYGWRFSCRYPGDWCTAFCG